MEKSNRVTNYLYKIADEIGSRRAGTRACKDTAEFISSVFSECGYEVDFFAIPFVSWESDNAEIKYDNSIITGFANIYSPAGIGEGEAVVLRNIYELKKSDIQGKVCIFTDELVDEVLHLGDSSFQSSRDVDVQEILDYNVPAAIISINPKVNSVLPYMEKYTGAPSLTVANIHEQEVLRLENKNIQVNVSSFSEDGVTGNVIAKTNNQNTKRKIVISAHYDTAEGSPGAWDNGSGVVALLELAKRFEKKDLKVQIEFAAMCPHEISYPGSIIYTNSEQAELEKVLLNINIDGIGASEAKDTITSDKLPHWIHSIIQKMLPYHEAIAEDGPIQVEGDHFAYMWNDIPSMLFTSTGNVSMHHENIDNLCNVDTDKILKVVDFIEEFIGEISAAI